jgi:hypothetical protein
MWMTLKVYTNGCRIYIDGCLTEEVHLDGSYVPYEWTLNGPKLFLDRCRAHMDGRTLGAPTPLVTRSVRTDSGPSTIDPSDSSLRILLQRAQAERHC